MIDDDKFDEFNCSFILEFYSELAGDDYLKPIHFKK